MELETRREASGADDLLALAAVALALGAFWLLAGFYRPPEPESVEFDAEQFSAGRAELVIERLQGPEPGPHPWGSEQAAALRERLASELRELGYEPELQVADTGLGEVFIGQVHNLLARLEGEDPERLILCSAHYDSVPAGPGVGDDLAGVAALVEIARVVRTWASMNRPRSSILFLFTDGEEAGLLGAKAFAKEHPWMEDVEVVVNLEARGTSGPSLLFETGEGDGWLIEHFAREARRPFTTSLAREVYKALPNDTDFSIFRDHGKSGANFAFIEDVQNYHTPLDDLENLDRGSLQHHGDNVQALLRSIWQVDLGQVQKSERVWFDVAGRWVISWPQAWCLPLSLAGLLSVLVAAVRFRRRGELRLAALLGGFLGVVLVVVASFFLSGLLSRTGAQTLPWDRAWAWVLLACIPGSLLVTLSPLIARAPGASLVPAATWSLLAVFASMRLPGGAHLFLLPASVLALLLHSPRAQAWQGSIPLGARWAGLLALLVAMPIWTPTFLGLKAALGWSQVGLLCAGVSLLALLLSPCFAAVTRHSRRWLLISAVAGLVLATGLRGLSRAVGWEERPRALPLNMDYVLDADEGQARWIAWAAGGRLPDELSEVADFSSRPAFVQLPWVPMGVSAREAEAPLIELEPAQIEVLAREGQGEFELLRLRLTSPDGADMTLLRFSVKPLILGTNRHIVSMDSTRVPPEVLERMGKRGPAFQVLKLVDQPKLHHGSGWLSFAPLPTQGVELELVRLKGTETLLRLQERHLGLPTEGQALQQARQLAGGVPIQFGDGTWIETSVELD